MNLTYKKIISLLFVTMGAFIISACDLGSQREYSWHQRATLTVPTEEGTVSGSSVMKITWSENSPRINDAPWVYKITGEMPFVELPNGDYVFSLMRNELNHIPSIFLLQDRQSNGWVTKETIEASPKGSVRICKGDKNFPLIYIPYKRS